MKGKYDMNNFVISKKDVECAKLAQSVITLLEEEFSKPEEERDLVLIEECCAALDEIDAPAYVEKRVVNERHFFLPKWAAVVCAVVLFFVVGIGIAEACGLHIIQAILRWDSSYLYVDYTIEESPASEVLEPSGESEQPGQPRIAPTAASEDGWSGDASSEDVWNGVVWDGDVSHEDVWGDDVWGEDASDGDVWGEGASNEDVWGQADMEIITTHCSSIEEAIGIAGFTPKLPSYLPEGYTVNSIIVYQEDGFTTVDINYMNDEPNPKSIYLSVNYYYDFEGEKSIGSDKSMNLESILKNNIDYLITWEVDCSHAQWTDDSLLYLISGPVSKETIKEIALSFTEGGN